MEIYLAGESPVKNGKDCDWSGLSILETYYYARNNKHFPALVKTAQNLLLDSGAFTFMANAHLAKIDYDKYVEEYAAFVNRYDVANFFELDIDSVVGIKEVERLRKKLERLTSRKPIPVWHISRGKEYFVQMCKEYPYVAVGGIVGKERPGMDRFFPWFINTAHKYGAKIHGLGYTSLKGLKTYKFDSVDSTAWLYGNIGGYVYLFSGAKGTLEQIPRKPDMRLRGREVLRHNFNEWCKFQKYARIYY